MRYRLKALDSGGQVVYLTVAAADAALAGELARERGLHVLNSHRVGAFGWPATERDFSLDLFVETLAALLDAGLPVSDAVATLAEQQRGGGGGAVVAQLNRDLREGLRFSQAAAQQPERFPALFVLSVRAAEDSGQLARALERFLAYRQTLARVRQRLISASIYPALLLAVALAVGAFMLLYVVPRFAGLYEGVGGALPWATRLLVDWGGFASRHGAAVGLAVSLVFVGGFLLWRRLVSDAPLPGGLARLPFLGERLRVFGLARFFRTLAMLLESGIALPDAVDQAAPLSGAGLREALGAAGAEIRRGAAPTAAFLHAGVADPLTARLLQAGEQGGRFAEMAGRVAGFHEAALARDFERLLAVLEPVLMLVIGAAIGLILLLLYLPIFELAENLH